MGLSSVLVGYGYHMWIPLVISIALVLIGRWVFINAQVKIKGPDFPLGFAYSLDMFLPLIRLEEKHYNDCEILDWRKQYLVFHKLLGWVLSFYVIAAVSGLTKL